MMQAEHDAKNKWSNVPRIYYGDMPEVIFNAMACILSTYRNRRIVKQRKVEIIGGAGKSDVVRKNLIEGLLSGFRIFQGDC